MLIHWVTGSVAALLELAFFRCSSTLVGVSLHKVGTTQIFFFFSCLIVRELWQEEAQGFDTTPMGLHFHVQLFGMRIFT